MAKGYVIANSATIQALHVTNPYQTPARIWHPERLLSCRDSPNYCTNTMTDNREDDSNLYTVVRNGEEQYSIWVADRPLPAGWISTGMVARKSECLAHIEEVWTDMRPLSLRNAMAQGVGSR